MSHRTDPAINLSKKAPKRTKEEQETRRLARAREDAERGGRTRSWKRKNAPPIVEDGGQSIRNRRGPKAKAAFAMNFTLKPMRSIAPVLRCDPARLERIRHKERANKEVEMHVSGSSSRPFDVELAEEYGSTSSAHHTMAESSTTSKFRANTDDSKRQRNSRKYFNKLIMMDVEAQAAKRRNTSPQDRPNPASTNSISSHEAHQRQRAAEFKDFTPTTARDRYEHKALGRLLSGGLRDKEHKEGRLLLTLNDRTSECRPASTSNASRLPDWDSR